MRPRRPAAAVALLLLLAALAACGDSDEKLPVACDDSVPAVQDALRTAPGDVALTDDTKLSTCVQRARTGADIQTIGALYTATADTLAAKLHTSDAAAIQLGFLVGAAQRGAAGTAGVHDELLRRLENSAGLDGAPPARQAAYRRGRQAGRDHG